MGIGEEHFNRCIGKGDCHCCISLRLAISSVIACFIACESSDRSYILSALPNRFARAVIFFMASGEGLACLFSQRFTVGNVTPSLAANFSWVSPRSCRNSRIRLLTSEESAKVLFSRVMGLHLS